MNAMAEKSLASDWQIILIPPLFFFFQLTSEDSTLFKEREKTVEWSFCEESVPTNFPSPRKDELQNNMQFIGNQNKTLALNMNFNSIHSANDFDKKLLTVGKCIFTTKSLVL